MINFKEHKIISPLNILFCIALIAILLVSSIWGGVTSLFSFLFLLFIPSLFFKNDSRYYYQLSFLVYSIIMCYLVNNFQIIQGSYFVTSMAHTDDQQFFELASEMASVGLDELDKIGEQEAKMGLIEGQRNRYAYYHHFSLMRPSAYIYTLFFWLKFINFFGISDNSALHGIFVNIAGSALSFVVLNHILKMFIDNEKIIKKIIIHTLLFVPLVYMGATLIRDSWIVLGHLLIVYLCCNKEIKTWLKLLLIALVLFYVYKYRTVTTVFVAIFIPFYWFFSLKSKKNRIIVLSSCLFMFLTILIALNQSIVSNISFYYLKYVGLINNNLGGNSLALRLVNSNNILAKMAMPAYILYQPIPPRFIKDFNPDTIILGIGSIQRYLIFPAYFVGIVVNWKNRKISPLFKAAMCNFFLVLLFVSITSKEERHFTPFYPIIVCTAFYFLYTTKNFNLVIKTYKIYFIFFGLALLAYGLIKLYLAF